MTETEILPGPPPCEVHHRFAKINGATLHYVEAYPATRNGNASVSGPLCLLLHGFPEFWYSWRHQIPALAAAGFHVIAPDLRGYNLSDKPPGISAYRIEVLLGDILGLIAAADAERAMIVGHDWGGVLAWQLAMRHPQKVEKLIILNAPHPAAYWRELKSWKQRLKSWYVLFFLLPAAPELLLGSGDFAWIDRMLRRRPMNPQAFGTEDVRRYKQALARLGALTAALNYYRALPGSLRQRLQDDVPIHAPVLLLWGERDPFLSVRLTEGLGDWVPNVNVVRFPDVSHWIQNEAPERVNRLMIEFLRAAPEPYLQSMER